MCIVPAMYMLCACKMMSALMFRNVLLFLQALVLTDFDHQLPGRDTTTGPNSPDARALSNYIAV